MRTSLGRLAARARVLHPFPSLLDAAVVAAVAAVAGAPAARIALLAGAMLVLQFAIGAANDWADAPADATANPAKPIPRGLVPRPTAALLAAVLAGSGLVLAAVAGAAAFVVASLGLAAGLAYDLRLKGTRWSWLPYAVGIPLLPVFAWVGATGELPVPFAMLVPLAVVAGAALAIANALADLERDRAAGTVTIATALGLERARRLGAVLLAGAATAAIATAIALGGPPAWVAVVVAPWWRSAGCHWDGAPALARANGHGRSRAWARGSWRPGGSVPSRLPAGWRGRRQDPRTPRRDR